MSSDFEIIPLRLRRGKNKAQFICECGCNQPIVNRHNNARYTAECAGRLRKIRASDYKRGRVKCLDAVT